MSPNILWLYSPQNPPSRLQTAASTDEVPCSQKAYDTVHYLYYKPAISPARLLAEQQTCCSQQRSHLLDSPRSCACFVPALSQHAHIRIIHATRPSPRYKCHRTYIRRGHSNAARGADTHRCLSGLAAQRTRCRPRAIVCTTGLPANLPGTRLSVQCTHACLPVCARTCAAVLQGPSPLGLKRQTKGHGDTRRAALPCAATTTATATAMLLPQGAYFLNPAGLLNRIPHCPNALHSNPICNRNGLNRRAESPGEHLRSGKRKTKKQACRHKARISSARLVGCL